MTEILIKFSEGVGYQELKERPDLADFRKVVASIKGSPEPRCFEGQTYRLRKGLESANAYRDKRIPSPDQFVHLEIPESTALEPLIDQLERSPLVEYAAAVPPMAGYEGDHEETREDRALPRRRRAPGVHDLTDFQDYLGPQGVNALAAWMSPGGTACRVRVCACEEGFVDHEDLPNVISLSDRNDFSLGDVNHGTRTLGILFGTPDMRGVTGICHHGTPLFSSSLGPGATSQSIYDAAARLEPGDVIVLAMEMITPLQVPVEWREDVHTACAAAVAQGIVVVAAAGNGNKNLETEHNQIGRLIWQRGHADENDSGALIVGAGLPPMAGPPARSRGASCYGSRVNCQGWANRVATTGIGGSSLGPSSAPSQAYTHAFGTSSATAMIAGTVACLQGIARTRDNAPLAPGVIRSLLSDPANGASQADASEHESAADFPIGPLPNLAKLAAAIGSL